MTSKFLPRYVSRFCGEDGLKPAAERVISMGLAGGHTDPMAWLEAVFEDEAENKLRLAGWQAQCGATRCHRAGRCKYHHHRRP